MKPDGKPPRAKLYVDLPPEIADTLDRLAEAEDMSKAAVVRRAIRLLDAALDASHRGGKLLLRAPSGAEREILLL